MRTREEIRAEREINTAWKAISNAGANREKLILLYANEGTPAIREWVAVKFRATLAALRADPNAPERAASEE